MSATAALERAPHRTLTEMPAPVRDVSAGLVNLAEHGVTIHENFISDDMADRLRERMEEQAYMERKLGIGRIGDEGGLSATPTIGEKGDLRGAIKGDPSEPIYQVLLSLPNKGKIFRELMMDKTAHAYANGVFGEHPWNVWGMNGIITWPGSAEQFLHTDSATVPQEMLTRPAMVNCFVCISDFDLDMGPTGFVPGSHLGPPPRFDGDERSPRAVAAAKKGSALIWEGRTWHGQCANQSDKPRFAIALSYCLYAVRPGENFCASIQDDVLEQLSEEEKVVLGFQTAMVGAMNAFGPRNASDRHYGIGSAPYFTPELHRD